MNIIPQVRNLRNALTFGQAPLGVFTYPHTHLHKLRNTSGYNAPMPLDKLPRVTTPPHETSVPPVAQIPHEEKRPKHTPVGPTVGIVIIVVLLLLGALYFWRESLNNAKGDPVPYIPGDQT